MLDVTRNVLALVEITKLNTTPQKIKFLQNNYIYTLLNPSSFYMDCNKLFNIPTDEIEMIKID